MSKQLLNKVMKAASVALLAGGMIGGAGFANNASANGKAKVSHAKVAKAIKKSAKNTKKNIRRSNRKANKKSKSQVARHNQKVTKEVAKKSNKKFNKAAAEKRALKRAKKISRNNREYNPLNHRNYRHNANRHVIKRNSKFVKSAYYRDVWTRAKKINKAGIRKDEKAMKYDQKKGYKSAVKYLQGKINYLSSYVRHDEDMLNK